MANRNREYKKMQKAWAKANGKKVKSSSHAKAVIITIVVIALLAAVFVVACPEKWLSVFPEAVVSTVLKMRNDCSTYELGQDQSVSASDSEDDYDAVYLTLKEAAEEGKSSAVVVCGNNETVQAAVTKLRKQPAYFWLGDSIMMTQASQICIVQFNNKDNDIAAKQSQIDEITSEIISGIPSDADDYTKALYIHDWLCNNIEYEKNESSHNGDIYGALVERKCVCGGYASAFKYLLDRVDIKNKLYFGEADNTQTTGAHVWNSAVLDGETYYFDVTWDDPASDQADFKFHEWFAVTYDDMIGTHFPDETSKMKKTNATADNYYYHNGFVLESCDAGAFAALLQKMDSTSEFLCANEEVFEYALSVLQDSQAFSEVLTQTSIQVSQCRFSVNELRHTIHLELT